MGNAHDCGNVVNPMAVEGQLEGSMHMGLGYALSEELRGGNGHTTNNTFLDYKMLTPEDMPRGESVLSKYTSLKAPWVPRRLAR